MSRSLKVAPEFIKKVKLAVKRNGFSSQQALSKRLMISRATISNFLNGRPVDFTFFTKICEILSIDWQAIAHIEGDTITYKEPLPNTFQEPTDNLFAEAADKWDLERLFTDMAAAKGSFTGKPPKQLTSLEMLLLEGLLCGYKPSEIAAKIPKKNKSREQDKKEDNENKKDTYKWIYVYLSSRLYRYIEELLAVVKIHNWREVPILLEKAGYRLVPHLEERLDSSSKARFLISCEVEEQHLEAIVTFLKNLSGDTSFRVEKISPSVNTISDRFG